MKHETKPKLTDRSPAAHWSLHEREMGDENTSEANVSLGYEDEDGNTPTKHDTLQRVDSADVVTQDERASSPEPSCISMKSDWSMDPPITLQDGGVTPEQREIKIDSDGPVPSCVSLKSDHSMDRPVTMKDRVSRSEQRVRQGRTSSSVPSCVSVMSDQSMDPPTTFKEGGASTAQRDQLARSGTQSDLSQQMYLSATLRLFEERFIGFVKEEIQKISRILRPDYTGDVEISEEDEDGRDAREASLKIAVHILKGMKELDLVEKLVRLECVFSQQKNLKHNLKSKTQRIFEGIAKQGNPAHLDKIYTELYITEIGSGTLNSDHEWSALVFVLLTSDDRMEVFDLRKYVQSDEGFKRLKPVAKASRTVKLSSCNLTKAICHSLGAVLASNSCATRVLDLSYNDLQDKGVKQLCIGLRNPLCLLETLKLQFCGIRRDGCSALVSALKANPSHLRELDLSYNPTGNDALTELLAFLPDCGLEVLRNLDLSENRIGDLGAGVFSALLSNENCKIEDLRLEKCNLTWKSCKILEGASTSVSCCLKELDLSDNDLQDTGVKLLAYDLKKCKLQKLKLSNCRFTEKGFSALASALKSNPTCLKELDVSVNFPGSKGMRELLSSLQQHSCALQTLCVDTCGLDSEICASFSTTLTQNSSLRELSLSNNSIGDEGVRSLSIGLQSGLSPLKILRLSDCSLTESSCEILASTLSSNTTGLIQLDLSRNDLGQTGAVFLCSISTINLMLGKSTSSSPIAPRWVTTQSKKGLVWLCPFPGLKMRSIVGVMCLCQCVIGQLLEDKVKGSHPRFICSVPGLPGTPGKPGPPGPTGGDGHVGIPGRDGRDGRKGEKGEKGEAGIKGRVGPTGKIGERGERGPVGKQGPEGESGDTGPPGGPGPRGKRGQKGHRGLQGVPGVCRCGSLVPKSAFSVGITSSYPAEQAPIKFNKVLFDEGGHYNPQTGKFVCAYPGIYYFSYDITLANKHLAIGLVQNGQYRIKTFDANTGNHDVASGSTVMYLNPEDEVWLEIFYKDQNGLFSDPGWADSLFSGFLLYADTNYLDTLAEDYA
ncbi:hypothetical protein AOLI_G00155600 [Acnodon oligacanthus]